MFFLTEIFIYENNKFSLCEKNILQQKNQYNCIFVTQNEINFLTKTDQKKKKNRAKPLTKVKKYDNLKLDIVFKTIFCSIEFF